MAQKLVMIRANMDQQGMMNDQARRILNAQ